MAVVGSSSLLHSTPLCDYITIYLALDGYSGYFQFVVSNAAMTILCLSFRGHMHTFLLGIFLGGGSLGHRTCFSRRNQTDL